MSSELTLRPVYNSQNSRSCCEGHVVPKVQTIPVLASLVVVDLAGGQKHHSLAPLVAGLPMTAEDLLWGLNDHQHFGTMLLTTLQSYS